jgi:hypothetical protein
MRAAESSRHGTVLRGYESLLSLAGALLPEARRSARAVPAAVVPVEVVPVAGVEAEVEVVAAVAG